MAGISWPTIGEHPADPVFVIPAQAGIQVLSSDGALQCLAKSVSPKKRALQKFPSEVLFQV
jgi:hypothetical protein